MQAQTADGITAVHDEDGDLVSYVGSVAHSLPKSGVVLIPLQPGELTIPVSLLWRPGTPRADVLENLAAQIRAAETPRR